jgi:hypothetical protein
MAFMMLCHGPEELKNFLYYHINIHLSIQFTMEIESNSHLPFLDIDVHRRPDGSPGHTVCRKPTHTDLYLNAESLHHLVSKHSVLSTLVHGARAIIHRGPNPPCGGAHIEKKN